MKASCRAYTLFEITIVLVIIGLITGGIMMGTNMLRTSKLHSLIDDEKAYATAVQQFRDKYGELPGDMTRATAVWGYARNDATCHNNVGGIPGNGVTGTCNGDGSGLVDVDIRSPAADSTESLQVWNQLSLAGLVGGKYTGRSANNNRCAHIFGTNSPDSKFSGSGWFMYKDNSGGGFSSHAYRNDYRNWLGVGSSVGSNTTDISQADGAFLASGEVMSIDSKLDDGLPGSGIVHALGVDTGCTDETVTPKVYNAGNNSTQACGILFNILHNKRSL